ncbi:MAG TPA: helix-turn-helix transcriptional regulator [Pseudonocardiaceae bacterium]
MAAGQDDPDRKLFAEELKAMRKQRGWSREELAKLISFSPSTIGNIEAAFRAPTREQALLLDKAFDTPGTFSRLEERLRGVVFSSGFRPFHPYEIRARTLKYFQNMLVPGMFQTEDYARAILESHPGVSAPEVEERVAGRMARQSILDRNDPPWMWIVLDEHVLHRNIGAPELMAAQLERLVTLNERPRINIQVIPDRRAYPGLLGAFVIAEMHRNPDGNPDIVYTETALEGQTLEHPDMAESATVLFDALRLEALTGDASLALIEEAVEQWKKRSEA